MIKRYNSDMCKRGAKEFDSRGDDAIQSDVVDNFFNVQNRCSRLLQVRVVQIVSRLHTMLTAFV